MHLVELDSNVLLSPRDDLPTLRARFKDNGRVLIPGMFDPAFAQGVLDAAHDHAGWLLVTRIEGKHREFDAAQMAQVPKDKLEAFEELVAQEARKGFQYRFERHLLYDNLRAGALPDGPLRAMAETLNSDAFIRLLHDVMDGYSSGQGLSPSLRPRQFSPRPGHPASLRRRAPR